MIPYPLDADLHERLGRLIEARPCAPQTWRMLRCLAVHDPRLCRLVLAGVESLDSLSVDDALRLIGYVARIRLSVQPKMRWAWQHSLSGWGWHPQPAQSLPSATLAWVSDQLPAWLIRELMTQEHEQGMPLGRGGW